MAGSDTAFLNFYEVSDDVCWSWGHGEIFEWNMGK